jgi:hypothetical protein
MAEIEKLPLKDVRYFAGQLVHSYGGLAALAEKHPWIREYSQDVVREVYGDQLHAWRYLTLKPEQKIEPENVVSLTGNPGWITLAIGTSPGVYWSFSPGSHDTTMIAVEHAILKYRLTPDRVIFYVPAIMDAARDMYGDSLKRWLADTSRRSPMSISKVFGRIAEIGEEEIVADVSGLKPETLNFRDKKDEWWWDKHLALDIARDRAEPVEQYVEDLIRKGTVVPNKEWPREKLLEHFRDIYRRLKEFFAP